MIKKAKSLRKSSPILWMLGSAQVLGHDHLAWLWGGVFWLMISRFCLIPRRMQRFSADTIPGLIGEIYGSFAQVMVGGIHASYFSLWLIGALQKWYALGYMEITWKTCLWIVLAFWCLIILGAAMGSVTLFRTVIGALLAVICMLLPFLVHFLRPVLDLDAFFVEPFANLSVLSTTYFPAIDPSIFWIMVWLGHPLLTYELLECGDKRKMIRLFKFSGIVLLGLAITNSIVVPQLGDPQMWPRKWQVAVFVYRAATYALSIGLLLYMTMVHVAQDILMPLKVISAKNKNFYLLAMLLSGLMVGASYVVPEGMLQEMVMLSLIPVAIVQLILMVILIGLKPPSFSVYTALFVAPLSYLVLRFFNVLWLQPYALGISVLIGCLVLLTLHYIHHQGWGISKRNWWEKQDVEEFGLRIGHLKHVMLSLLYFPFKMTSYARQGVARQRTPYRSLSLYFCLIGLLAIRLWPIPADAPYVDLAYRIFALNLVCGLLALLQPLWPRFLAPYFALYWYFYLTSHLVVTPAMLYVISSYDTIALVHLVLSIILLARLVSPLSFFVIHVLSLLDISLSLRYLMPDQFALLQEQPQVLYTFMYSYLAAYLVGALFIAKNKQEMEETKQKLKSLVKKSIAIVSNSLNITKSYASIIELCMDTMDVTEEPDTEEGNRKVVISMEQNCYNTMQENLAKLLETMNTGRAQLKRVFLPINSTIRKQEFAEYHASPCVREAIATFVKDYEVKQKPKLKIERDFTFSGSDQALIAVLIQLLRNAHEYSHAQGEISIRVKDHKIYIINDGSFVFEEDLPHIFNEYFSTKPDNLGLGLFFAKEVMESFGGKIYLSSSQAEGQTCLVLAFPEK